MTRDHEEPPNREEDPRYRFAAERTLLVWVRTGLAFMGFGFVVARFGLFLRMIGGTQSGPHHSTTGSLWVGMGLVILGVVVTFLAALEHWRILRRMNLGQPYQPPRWSLGLFVVAGMMALGVGMVAYLLQVDG